MTLKTAGASALLLALGSTTALAGGLERSVLNLSPLFEDGRYLEFSASYVLPSLSGDDGTVPPGFIGATPIPITGNTGDLLEAYANFGAAYKADINDSLSYALIINQPLGSSTEYPVDPTADGVPPFTSSEIYGGSSASLESVALTGLLAYETNGFTIYGGPVVQAIRADASLTFIPGGGYTVDAETSYGIGFTGGVAYERPDIALRVALTYRSEINHEFDTTETIGATSIESQTEIDTPQSITLDFQTGVAKDTLVFGQVHWVDWSSFEISPPNYPLLAIGRPLVAYEEDYITYTLGVGRRFTENWSGAVSFVYEPQTDTELTSLGPVDGRYGVNLGATYENDRYKISGGVNYTVLGSARNVLDTDFDGGEAFGVGFRVGFKL